MLIESEKIKRREMCGSISLTRPEGINTVGHVGNANTLASSAGINRHLSMHTHNVCSNGVGWRPDRGIPSVLWTTVQMGVR